MLRHGWRTGAIVPELEVETKVVNTEQYAQSLTWLQALTGLLERMQVQSALRSKLSITFPNFSHVGMTHSDIKV